MSNGLFSSVIFGPEVQRRTAFRADVLRAQYASSHPLLKYGSTRDLTKRPQIGGANSMGASTVSFPTNVYVKVMNIIASFFALIFHVCTQHVRWGCTGFVVGSLLVIDMAFGIHVFNRCVMVPGAKRSRLYGCVIATSVFCHLVLLQISDQVRDHLDHLAFLELFGVMLNNGMRHII